MAESDLTPAGELWQRAARWLTGRPVTVYVGEPSIKGADASFERGPEGGRIIISERAAAADPDELLRLFFHECAHAIDDWDAVKPAASDHRPRSVEYSPLYWRTYAIRPEETSADSMADRWLGFARRVSNPRDSAYRKLAELMDHFERSGE